MANSNQVTRIFGGKYPQVSGDYTRPLLNPANQTDVETLAVGTTRRLFRGPKGSSNSWSYHVNVVGAAGATSTLKFYYSDLPNPDPTVAAHWKDSGITAIDLASAAVSFATKTGDFPEWIMAEAVVATSTGTVWAYVRSHGNDA